MTEEVFQAQVIQLAKMLGWKLVYHTRDSRRSAPGFPDLILGYVNKGRTRARLVVAELKVGKNTTTPEQDEWLAFFELLGLMVPNVITTRVWYPTDWDDITKVLGDRT